MDTNNSGPRKKGDGTIQVARRLNLQEIDRVTKDLSRSTKQLQTTCSLASLNDQALMEYEVLMRNDEKSTNAAKV